PSISVENGVVTLTPNDDFSTIYYSVNGSDYKEYTGSFEVADTDLVKAYASGLGIAQSETVLRGIEVAVTSEIAKNPSTGVIPEFAITVTNTTGKAVNGAQLIVVSTDGEQVTSTITRTVDIRSGITYIDDIAPVVKTDAADPKVSVYLWKSPDTIMPLTLKNTYQIED
ncbi:MAG: chitobiase/beta-hexosaminidase C-terminal domain-containing protein, partial [Oscillospiraceae bacterium]|nr:chitobiase/beta-hexosaminidase C-terminal domain-containing protein [Oscillospiraceae bacterium]